MFFISCPSRSLSSLIIPLNPSARKRKRQTDTDICSLRHFLVIRCVARMLDQSLISSVGVTSSVMPTGQDFSEKNKLFEEANCSYG